MNPTYAHDDDPGLEGPDYVTLVIEWDEGSDAATLVSAQQPTGPSGMLRSRTRKIAAVVGALAAIVFATWGMRHLRATWGMRHLRAS